VPQASFEEYGKPIQHAKLDNCIEKGRRRK